MVEGFSRLFPFIFIPTPEVGILIPARRAALERGQQKLHRAALPTR